MSGSNASDPVVSPESSEKSRNAITDSEKSFAQYNLVPQNCSSIDGPVAILWDIENCCVPKGVNPENVAGNIRMALQVHPIIKGAVVMFSAYGDFNSSTRRVREGCQRTGVKLIDVPNGRKDAADKAILVDMFLFALDNPPPSSIMLISGDVDFAPALHILGQRGYTVILVLPSGGGVSSALCSAGRFVWDWQSMARGEGIVPATKALAPYQSQLVGPGPVSEHDLNGGTNYMNKFCNRRGLKTPTFDGTADSIQAEAWLDQVEKDFEVTQCPMEYKVCIAECLLLGEAKHWWQSVQSVRAADVVITWEDFVRAFIQQHYPDSVREGKMLECLKLEQGSLTVTAYEQCFSKLFRFVTHTIRTEELKALKFHCGLRLSIRTKVELFPLTSYAELVSRALVAERNEWTEGAVNTSKGDQNMPVANHCVSMEEVALPRKANTLAKPPRRQLCVSCGKIHGIGPCRALTKACYRCGQTGHYVKACPYGQHEALAPQDHIPLPAPPAKRHATTARVHALGLQSQTGDSSSTQVNLGGEVLLP